MGFGNIDWQSGLATPFPLTSDGIEGLGFPTTITDTGLAFNQFSPPEGFMPIPPQSPPVFHDSTPTLNSGPAVPNPIPIGSLLANSTAVNTASNNAGLTTVAPTNSAPIPEA